MKITADQLRAVCTALGDKAEAWIEPLNAALETIEADRPTRAADFISQWAHESVEFTRLVENLSYSAARLLEMFPWHPQNRTWGFVNIEDAKSYAGRQADTANRIYGGRMGNQLAGDGWAYIGRGLPMITGRYNYWACSIAICGDGDTLLNNPELLCEPNYAMAAAAWFWAVHDLNRFSDAGDYLGMTKKINGGTHGYTDRLKYRRRARRVLGLSED